MSDKELELARIQLELLKVAAARHEMQFNIKQRQAEITRLEKLIQVQLDKEAELAIRIQDQQNSITGGTN